MGLQFGIYAAASSVVCSGRPGSLYVEDLDARTFADWSVDYVKYDNCGEYALGVARFYAFSDAVNRTGRAMAISTEPFSITPTPLHAEFANLWRTGNDINANYGTITNRADLNDKWGPFTGPGAWADPDMIQCGNGGLSDAECRTNFGLWAVMKAPLIIGADLRKLSASQLAIITNPGVIAVNQDPLGVQARKLAANGTVAPQFVGLAPCAQARGSIEPGINGVSAATLVWTPLPLAGAGDNTTFSLYHNATGRCLSVALSYPNRPNPVPVLLPCSASDPYQAWWVPRPLTTTGLVNVALNLSLTAGDSTVYGAVHGSDPVPVPDAAYGITNLTFTPYAPEPPCNNRGCDNYVPEQTWYWSPSTGRISLALMSANIYRCFEGSCYTLTGHLPTYTDFCLSSVQAISNDGVDTNVGGVHVWGGPLSGGAYVLAIENRGATAATGTAFLRWLEVPGIGDATTFCARELFSDTALGSNLVGSVSLTVQSHDTAVLRVVPGASSC